MGKEFTTALLSETGHQRRDGEREARDERERLARNAYAKANKPLFTNPLYLALALGYQLRPVTAIRPAPVQRERMCLYYDWATDREQVGLHVYQCISAALFVEAGRTATDSDVALLVAELALPEHLARSLPFYKAVTLQSHVPKWWVRARLTGFRASGVRTMTA